MDIRTDRFDSLPQIKVAPRPEAAPGAPPPQDQFTATATALPAPATDTASTTAPPAPPAPAPQPQAQAQPSPSSNGRPPASPNVIYMDENAFDKLVADMPKVELHNHIEGNVRPETILDLAQQYHVDLPAQTVAELRSKIGMKAGETLLDFLKKFDCFRFVFDQPETLKRLAYEAIEDNAKQNVKYTEIRINPIKHPDKVPVGQVIDAILDGMDQAKKDFGVDASLIVSLNRSYSVESAMDVAKEAVARKDRGVVGMDLAGDEVHFPPQAFKEVFQFAKSHGLGVTIHAGEAVGPDSIRHAVEDCGATRIGHGVRAQEDPQVVDLLRDKGVHLELCPTSNLLLNVVPNLKTYPLASYMHTGIPVTINTDDAQIFNTNLDHEYSVLARETGLSLQDLEHVAHNGVEAAFLSPEKKKALEAEFQAAMDKFNSQLPRKLYTITHPQTAPA